MLKAALGKDSPEAPLRRRGGRWGKKGCDWRLMELEYALGLPRCEIARRAGVSVHTVRDRIHREKWSRSPPAGAWAALIVEVGRTRAGRALADAAAGAPGGDFGKLMSAALKGVAEASKGRMMNGGWRDEGWTGGGGTGDGGNGDGRDWIGELRRRIERLVGALELGAGDGAPGARPGAVLECKDASGGRREAARLEPVAPSGADPA